MARLLHALSFICFNYSGAATVGNPMKFLIMSAPRDGKISYQRIRGGNLKGPGPVGTLISTGLVHPQGIAVDQKGGRLLVADPDSRTIYAYTLENNNGELLAGAPTALVTDIESRWVAADGVGNVFFSDEPQNKIMKLSAGVVKQANTTATTAFNGASLRQVSAPGGIAVDSFNAYWVNKQVGKLTGSVVRGSEAQTSSATSGASVMQLSTNTDKSYGVCIALNNVYYTQPERTIYGVKKTGGEAVMVSDRLTNPRGCAWDGDGTIYVADRGANAVYSFAGNMKDLSLAQVTKTVDYADVFGVAVFSSSARLHLAVFAMLAVLSTASGIL